MSARLRLFLSSYVPLFVISAVRLDCFALRIVLMILAMVGLLSLVSLIRVSAQRIEPRVVTPMNVQDLGSEAASYLTTYLLPFVMVGDPGTADVLAYALVLVTIAIVFVKSDMVGVNPLLYLLGYRIYSAEGIRSSVVGVSVESLVISRLRVDDGLAIRVADLTRGVSLVLPTKKESSNARTEET